MNRAERRAAGRRPPPRRTFALDLPGELAGFRVVMGSMTGADIIALRSGDMTEAAGLRLVAERVVEHDFDVESALDLDAWILVAILEAWTRAMEEAALPPATGGRSSAP